jgi:spermidine synthase
MKKSVVTQKTDSIPLLPLLLVLFIGSGCAALIYEIVWSQLLELVIGASAISLGVLLGTFMGGMCAGSLLFPRWVSAERHPLQVYAVLELGIAVFSLLILFGMPYIAGLYGAIGAFGFWGIALRTAICVVCLMPPTLLMGATLPAISRWVRTTPIGISWLGFFYGGNIGGAVLGSALAGFYLLRIYDMATATFVGVAINVTVALAAFVMSNRAPYAPLEGDSKQVPGLGSWPVYVTIALSGMAAMGAEVVWTRLLSMLFGASVYAFSIILAVFLAALGIGTSRASAMSRWSANPRRDLGICQALLIAAVAWSAYMTNSSLPYWPMNPTLTVNLWHNFQMDFFRCALAIGPAACLWGASFPFALAAAASRGQDPGRLVGGVYAANTIGGIVGVAIFSLVYVAGYGTRQAQQALIVISAIAALLALVPAARNHDRRSMVAAVVAVVLAGIFVVMAPEVPGGFVAYGRFFANVSYNLRTNKPTVIYSGEGMNASVAVTQLQDGTRNFHVSGKIEASTVPRDMKVQRMLGHLPALYHPAPRSVLIVGFGAGVTAGAFTLYPSVERIVICEIEPLIPHAVAPYFSKQNYNVLKDPRVEVVYDDARNFIRTTHEKFDVISYDSIHPWVKGAATLYTDEYFKLALDHLNPGGTISLWVPLYECSMEAAKSQIATFMKTFPNGTVWGNTLKGGGYDLALMAKKGDASIDLAQLTDRLERHDHLNVKYSLAEVDLHSSVEVASLYSGRGSDLAPWLADAQINEDRNLKLQYLAGLALNLYEQEAIYNTILSYRKFPDDLFTGSSELKEAVKKNFAIR